MSARYCKRKGCSANEGTPCESASVCAYWEWDIAREKGDKPQESKLTPREDEEQKEFAAWLDGTGLLWYHTPNERRASVTELVNLTAQGMKKGVPDNFIAEPRGKYHGLYIELKRSKKSLSRKSPEQRVWIESLNEKGYKAVFCYGAEEAKRVVLEYIKGAEK
jgi:VRR-NUC domain-containing protein|nr:MAG TPA: Nuclease [Caudoviricetes sp.]